MFRALNTWGDAFIKKEVVRKICWCKAWEVNILKKEWFAYSE